MREPVCARSRCAVPFSAPLTRASLLQAPPLAPPGDLIYLSVRDYMRKRLYEGPTNWTSAHTALALASTKPAQFDETELQFRLERALGIGATRAQALVRTEAARYLHMVYVRARPPTSDRRLPRLQASGSTGSDTAAAGATGGLGASGGGRSGGGAAEDSPIGPAPSDLLGALAQAARSASPDGTVLVLYTNGGFSQLAQNALCSLRRFDLLARSLVLAHDPATCAALRSVAPSAYANPATSSSPGGGFTERAPQELSDMRCVALPPPRKRGGDHGGDHGSIRDHRGNEVSKSRALTAAGGAARWGSAAYRRGNVPRVCRAGQRVCSGHARVHSQM